MKVFVTGHNGLLGRKLLATLLGRHEVVTWENLDIRNRDDVMNIPWDADVIVHCAAMTDVDGCEKDKYNAWQVNVEGTKNIVDRCKEFGTKLVFISSDYVLDCVNFYAYTKLIGEEVVQAANIPFLIVRSSTLYGYNPNTDRKGVIEWIMNSKEPVLYVYGGNLTCPTLVDDLADNLINFIEQDACGIRYVLGKSCVTKDRLAEEVVGVFRLGKRVIPTSKVANWVAKRPDNLNPRRFGIYDTGRTRRLIDGLKFMKHQMERDNAWKPK